MHDVAIIDSGGANLASLEFALARLAASCCVTSDAATIRAAPRVLLPGVGSAGAAMQRLRERGLAQLIPTLRQPLLGICLGMQLLYESSEEDATRGLAILPGQIRRLQPAAGLPVPHMGWNQLLPQVPDPLLGGVGATDYLYFVHSYAAPLGAATLALTEYGHAFSAVVRARNFWGTQFHPERSSRAGARILENFLRLP
jgi:imidazole glycerol-phosphate synthase subunit HisH